MYDSTTERFAYTCFRSCAINRRGSAKEEISATEIVRLRGSASTSDVCVILTQRLEAAKAMTGSATVFLLMLRKNFILQVRI